MKCKCRMKYFIYCMCVTVIGGMNQTNLDPVACYITLGSTRLDSLLLELGKMRYCTSWRGVLCSVVCTFLWSSVESCLIWQRWWYLPGTACNSKCWQTCLSFLLSLKVGVVDFSWWSVLALPESFCSGVRLYLIGSSSWQLRPSWINRRVILMT